MGVETTAQGGVAPGAERRNPTVHELVDAMEGMPLSLGYDELANEPVKTGPLPWDERAGTRPWSQLDDAELFAHLQDGIGLRLSLIHI